MYRNATARRSTGPGMRSETTPGGEELFGMMSVFADSERARIQGRVRAGLARARARESGTKSGKPIGRPRIPEKTEEAISKALKQLGRPGVRKIVAQAHRQL